MAILGPEGKKATARHCARAASLAFIAVSRVARVKDRANVTLMRASGAYVKRSPATNSVDLRCSAGCTGSRLDGPEPQASGIARRQSSWRQWAPLARQHGACVPLALGNTSERQKLESDDNRAPHSGKH